MITKDNLTECLNQLSKEEIEDAMASNEDYILFELNSMGVVFFMATDFDEQLEQNTINDGNVFIDKDNFGILINESNSIHKNM